MCHHSLSREVDPLQGVLSVIAAPVPRPGAQDVTTHKHGLLCLLFPNPWLTPRASNLLKGKITNSPEWLQIPTLGQSSCTEATVTLHTDKALPCPNPVTSPQRLREADRTVITLHAIQRDSLRGARTLTQGHTAGKDQEGDESLGLPVSGNMNLLSPSYLCCPFRGSR